MWSCPCTRILNGIAILNSYVFCFSLPVVTVVVVDITAFVFCGNCCKVATTNINDKIESKSTHSIQPNFVRKPSTAYRNVRQIILKFRKLWKNNKEIKLFIPVDVDIFAFVIFVDCDDNVSETKINS